MKHVGLFTVISSIAAGLLTLDLALAQSLPPSPQAPTRYEQCQQWHDTAKVVLDELNTVSAQCSYKITYETMRDQVTLACGGGTTARVCAKEREAASCAYRSASQVLTACRHSVSVFLKGQANPDDGLTDRTPIDDLRDDLIGGYIGGFPGPLDALDVSGKDFLTKVDILKRTWDTMRTPTPDAILSTGQAFSSNVFAGSGAGALAADLFEAGSGSVAATGASAVNQMTESLRAFDAAHSEGASYPAPRGIDMLTPAASPQGSAAPKNTKSGSMKPQSQSCSNPHGGPSARPGQFICLGATGYAHACICEAGRCYLDPYPTGSGLACWGPSVGKIYD